LNDSLGYREDAGPLKRILEGISGKTDLLRLNFYCVFFRNPVETRPGGFIKQLPNNTHPSENIQGAIDKAHGDQSGLSWLWRGCSAYCDLTKVFKHEKGLVSTVPSSLSEWIFLSEPVEAER
jgi:hypothetical protein